MVYTIYGDGDGDNDDDDCKMDGDDVEDIESMLQLDQKEIIQWQIHHIHHDGHYDYDNFHGEDDDGLDDD